LNDPQPFRNYGIWLAEALVSAWFVFLVDLYRTQHVPPIQPLGAGEAILIWLFALLSLQLFYQSLAYLHDRLLWPLLITSIPPAESPVVVLEIAPPWSPNPDQPEAEPADSHTVRNHIPDDFSASDEEVARWMA
jgi:hypothetical protein